MRSLLDINVLIPLFDVDHASHDRVHAWWSDARSQGWASCPLTQNGFARITSLPGYKGSLPAQQSLAWLARFVAGSDHVFWPDDVSIVDDAVIDRSAILGPGQIADVYLLALAVRHGGRLVTLDRAVPAAAVRGGRPEHLLVL